MFWRSSIFIRVSQRQGKTQRSGNWLWTEKSTSSLELIWAIRYWLLIRAHVYYCNTCYLSSQIWSLAKRPQAINHNEITKTKRCTCKHTWQKLNRVTNPKWVFIDDMHKLMHEMSLFLWKRRLHSWIDNEDDWMCGPAQSRSLKYCTDSLRFTQPQHVYRIYNDVNACVFRRLSVNLPFDAL